ncbi:hypothetical protein V8F20_006089 [Naviculisporaceae sp. PSN 640]
MRQTLRRSCAACAKSKHSCDLRTPRCSRCIKRRVQCQYANEPLNSSQTPPGSWDSVTAVSATNRFSNADSLYDLNFASSPDPFDTYPKTRLPRDQVQRLIHGFLNKISFQYYPLDLTKTSNPFLISWWPLALGDPALFHVSLQTACLDAELIARKGFHTSEILMADSVALLRRKVQDPVLAVQDGTMNSVVTLAAIEFGKGNGHVAEMHVDGLKRLVNMRGGINAVRQTSPLTARMVSWVAMLIMGKPQFDAQDDFGNGNGIPPPPEWQLDFTIAILEQDLPRVLGVSEMAVETIDSQVRHVFIRLHNLFHRAQTSPISSTLLHDLTCYVVHRLLLLHPDSNSADSSLHNANGPSPSRSTISLSPPSTSPSISFGQPSTEGLCPSPLSECIRYAMLIYMLITQGPTYYSHHVILNTLTGNFIEHLEQLDSDVSATTIVPDIDALNPHVHLQPFTRRTLRDPLDIWLIAIGLVAATGTQYYQWFKDRGTEAVLSLLSLESRNDLTWEGAILPRIKGILWLEKPKAEDVFKPHWEGILGGAITS